MPARLRAHAIAAGDPTRAAHQAAATVLGDAPRGRTLTLAVARWGAHAGLRPSPWVLDGVIHAIQEAGLSGQALHVGERGAIDPITARLAARGLPALEPHAPVLVVRGAGSRRALRIPRPALGGSLCLVLPCVHRQHPGKDGPAWRGPIGEALASLAAAWGAGWSRDPVDAVTRGLAEAFAHVTVVIDAGWWAPLSAGDDAAPHLLAPERVLSLRLPSPVAGESALDPLRVDAWLGAQLGLPAPRRHAGEAPRVVGPAAHAPWPRLPRGSTREPSPAAAPRGPSALAALWRRDERPSPRRAALPPAVPGALARLWSEYDAPATAATSRGRSGA
jgi:hypothetical protein